jgi:signal transduction histidine kinase
MNDGTYLRHFGGGRRGLFLLLRYLFIVAASYLLLFQGSTLHIVPSHALMIAVALGSNVALSLAGPEMVFSWYVEAPVLIADTLWVSWAIHSLGVTGPEFFLLYFFVLCLAAIGESLSLVLFGATLVSAVNIYFSAQGTLWTTANVLYVIFFFAVALFYGHVISEIKRERQRADRGFAWAKDLEARVAERTAQLSRLYAESLAVNRQKSEFMANISHELRTPLGIILGYSELLVDPETRLTAEEREHMLRRICSAAHSELRLVDSVLDLGLIEAGKLPANNRPLRLDRFVADLQQRPWQPLGSTLALRWCVPAKLPVIETDAAKLTIILDSLIENALKFTQQGTVTLTLTDFPTKRQVEFRIDDTGPGIDGKDLSTIFEAFRQLDSSSTRRHEGLGIGLAMVQRYATLLGATINVTSTLGSGSSFVVTLPYCPARVSAAAHQIGAGETAGASQRPAETAARQNPPTLA